LRVLAQISRRNAGAALRPAVAVALAAVLLVVIGTLEAAESVRQLAEAVGTLRLGPAGAGLTALGLLASTAVYLGLGRWAGDDRSAVRLGAMAGVVAGIGGGTVRAWLIADTVSDIVARYASVPEWFVPGALAVFVGLSTLASAVGGAAIAFAGVRLRRTTRGAKS
jgi:hypothetical protein